MMWLEEFNKLDWDSAHGLLRQAQKFGYMNPILVLKTENKLVEQISQ